MRMGSKMTSPLSQFVELCVYPYIKQIPKITLGIGIVYFAKVMYNKCGFLSGRRDGPCVIIGAGIALLLQGRAIPALTQRDMTSGLHRGSGFSLVLEIRV